MLPSSPRSLALAAAALVVLSCDARDGQVPPETMPPADTEPAAPVAAAGPRLVILYAPCTVNADLLGPYDDTIPFTPALDAFAEDAVVFERHHTETGLSGIAYASILTGFHAPGHGIHTHPRVLDEDHLTIPDHFAAEGYETFFWDGHDIASSQFGYGQGVPPANRFVGKDLAGFDSGLRRILERLQAEPDYRAFVMAFFSVSHTPYADTRVPFFCRTFPERCTPLPGESIEEVSEYQRLHASETNHLSYDFPATAKNAGLEAEDIPRFAAVVRRMYESRLHLTDQMFGEVVQDIQKAGLYDESLIAFTSDHGETGWRDNLLFPWGHGPSLEPEVLRVALLVKAPGLAPGRYAGVSRSIDVFPTLSALAGLSVPQGLRGEDLSGDLGEATPSDRIALSHSAPLHTHEHKKKTKSLIRRYYPEEAPEHIWVRARQADLVVKWAKQENLEFAFEAYALDRDPEERNDLFDPKDPQHAALRDQLIAYKSELVDNYIPSTRKEEVGIPGAEQRELLRRLGYLEE